MVELAQQPQQLALVALRKGAELLDQQRVVPGHDLIVRRTALFGQKQAIDAPIRAALEEATAFHLVQELTDVAFGHQQRISQLLLTDTFGRAYLRQHVKLSRAEL